MPSSHPNWPDLPPPAGAEQKKECMNMTKIPHRLYLTEEQLPRQWFNLRSAMGEQPDPLLNPATLQPLGVEDLAPIFCEELGPPGAGRRHRVRRHSGAHSGGL